MANKQNKARTFYEVVEDSLTFLDITAHCVMENERLDSIDISFRPGGYMSVRAFGETEDDGSFFVDEVCAGGFFHPVEDSERRHHCVSDDDK